MTRQHRISAPNSHDKAPTQKRMHPEPAIGHRVSCKPPAHHAQLTPIFPMPKPRPALTITPDPGSIQIRGARQNNLKGFDLDLPLGKLIVVTGPSGSGKSSLAFDTVYAEGQRRYVETFSPYTRQFLDRMDIGRAHV